jgi:hypothetical protein
MKIENKENIVCPWCEYNHKSDGTEFIMNNFEQEKTCVKCHRDFYVEIIHQPPLFTTNTQKLCERCYKNYIENGENYCKECRIELTNMTGIKY